MYGHVALGFRAPLPPKPKLVDHKHINGEVHTDATPVPEATTKPETTDVKEGEPADKREGPAPELVSIIVSTVLHLRTLHVLHMYIGLLGMCNMYMYAIIDCVSVHILEYWDDRSLDNIRCV